MQRFNGFLSLKGNILSIQSLLFFCMFLYKSTNKCPERFLWNTLLKWLEKWTKQIKLFNISTISYLINTTHILDISCCHKHQQQRYHHENTKKGMFTNHMYVDIVFPLTKAITIFERVTPNILILLTLIGYNATRYHIFNALPHALPLALPYIFTKLYMGTP